MNFRETMDYFDRFPPFSPAAVASGEEAFNLNAIRELLVRLGSPEKKLRFLHIAGTNGKGSTAAFLSSILIKSGYRTGCFSSPYLTHFTEQIRIDEEEIGEEDLARLATRVRQAAEGMAAEGLQAPSAYEVTCAIGFLYFAQQNCEFVVLEVGLGGRLDATNVIPTPELAIVTSISFDHTEILGETLEQIATEKGGIIKEGGTVLLYPQSEAVERTICGLCREKEAELFIPSTSDRGEIICDEDGFPTVQEFEFEGMLYQTSLLGSYQIRNAAMAIAAAKKLREHGFAIGDEAIRVGIAETDWIGRFELLQKSPVIIADGSHNAEGAGMLRENLLRYFPEQKMIFLVGVLADKSYQAMLGAVSDLAECFFTVTPDSPRALPAKELARMLEEKGYRAFSCDSMEEALESAIQCAGPDGVICAFGSLYYIGAFREAVISRKDTTSKFDKEHSFLI